MCRIFIFLIPFLFIMGCASKSDELGIGKSPIPPADSRKQVTLVQGPNLSKKLMRPNTDKNDNHTPTEHTELLLLAGNGGGFRENVSDLLSIMSPEGGVLTLWALNVGNWVWGYSLIDSQDFGGARIWRIFTKADGSAAIQNAKEGTCLSAYRNGVIHNYCNMEDPAQLWKFNLFDNQAVQIQNVATKQCLQTPSNQATRFFSIFLTDCVQGGRLNSDQQWFITAPPLQAGVVFSTDGR
ncbi:RICIN domain-containing protein [Helicobacter winghamensis]|mgnify:CR=1 FL=1|uniref:Cytolethal distending toxin subunit A n=1 Tax=Helicobacter winghamensis TaxID=157268 RepID=A0A2N3PJW3_9HELI|nr:RICIN domain-containing protein [Helicobacter winghamensis]EEO26324.1 cytolethal distending toxin A/C family [Helicobacter winghamensis ATCC BAA-430]PKT77309.1 toxin [Helicobacter winghamensis]PKT77510.1 toxin [Helicobacter winghamensis]PKT77758.1 toxin [Helicobacter winghamensis]PKT81475.1 toxin [Helicobacter winghamensis]